MFVIFLSTVLVLAGGNPVQAQFLEDFEEKLWGVQVSFTPEWRSVDQAAKLFEFEDFSMAGSDYSIGFARGRMRSGHWGLSLMRQRWQEAAVCTARFRVLRS
jgi:hypothetical protein